MIGIIKSKQPIVCNFRKWVDGESRVLFIGGLSGSGKSTAARKITEEAGAKYVCLDQYIKKLIRGKTGSDNPDYLKEAFECGIALVLEDNPEGQLVVEGAQIRWFNPEEIKKHAVIFFRTSLVTSCWRACMRDFNKEHWDKWKTIEPHLHIGINLKTFKSTKAFVKML